MSIPRITKNKGNVNRYGFGVTIFSNIGETSWCWVKGKGWVDLGEANMAGIGFSSHYGPCRTLRAFKRHVRKYCSHIKNAEIVWCQRHGSNAILKV